MARLRLYVVHFHLRPGGIRRIIELAAPYLLRESGGSIDGVTIASGEAPDSAWRRLFEDRAGDTRVEWFVEPAFHYISEQAVNPDRLSQRIRAGIERLLTHANSAESLVWAHNLGVGRNFLLTRELVRACAERGVKLLLHQHDWWFDSRWLRWPELRRSGFRTRQSAAQALFPAGPNVRYLAINQQDAGILQRHFGNRAAWLPNLMVRDKPPSAAACAAARVWLQRKLNDRDAPVWLLPCRLLRRKNVAEAVLLTRWLRPEAWLVVTGGVSSADEEHYAERLAAAAHQHRWRLRLGILQGDESRTPCVHELLAVSEAVVLTSIQEGFGLPYLEAAVARRPLLARALPNIAPDLARFGFRFPQLYADLLVDPHLFDWERERRQQRRLFATWRNQIPRACRPWTGKPLLLEAGSDPQPVPFSRLTLTAQLEVLAQPVRRSWELCAPLNPFLPVWRQRAAAGRLRVTPWPRTAASWLSGPAYAQRFLSAANASVFQAQAPHAAVAAQEEFIRSRLDAQHLFPLLWSTPT